MEGTALVVVDLQNDYCHPDGLCYQNGQRLADRIGLVRRASTLIDAARETGVFIAYCQMVTHSDDPTTGPWAERRTEAGLAHICLEGTWGHDFVGDVTPKEGDVVIPKTRFSGFEGTSLDQVLRDNGIEDVYVCGVATNGCVDLTLRDAFQRNYRVFGVADACGAYEKNLHEAALQNWSRSYGEAIEASVAISNWSAPRGR